MGHRRTPTNREGAAGSLGSAGMTAIVAAAILTFPAGGVQAQGSQPWSVASPDGRTAIAVSRQPDGRPVYRVTRDGQPVLGDSPLGIRRADQAFDAALTFVSVSPVRNIDDRCHPRGTQGTRGSLPVGRCSSVAHGGLLYR